MSKSLPLKHPRGGCSYQQSHKNHNEENKTTVAVLRYLTDNSEEALSGTKVVLSVWALVRFHWQYRREQLHGTILDEHPVGAEN